MVSSANSGALARIEEREGERRAPGRAAPSTWSAGQLATPAIALPLLVGLAVRVALALAFAGTAPIGDELAYTSLGERWARTGSYAGHWAPGYPALLAGLTALFGDAAADMARGLQALLGLVIGGAVAHLAGAFGGHRAARAAAWLHAVYLPLAGFAALLFSETLFLALLAPALALLATGRPGVRAHAIAGLLLGAALLVREGTLLLLPPLALWLAWPRGDARVTAAAARAALLRIAPAAAGLALAVAPWVLADAAEGGPPRPIARTAGANAFIGLNAHDINFDVALLPEGARSDLRSRLRGPAPEPWADAVHEGPGPATAEASRENVTRGLRHALQNPGFAARARLVELVDLLAPTCYLVRQFRAVDGIGAPLDTPARRRGAAAIASVSFPVLALLAVLGAATLRRREGAARDAAGARPGWLCAALVAGTCAVALVNAVTRFRAPMLPLLLVLAALWLSAPRAPRAGAPRRAAIAAAAVLALLWLPSLGTSWAAIVAAGR